MGTDTVVHTTAPSDKWNLTQSKLPLIPEHARSSSAINLHMRERCSWDGTVSIGIKERTGFRELFRSRVSRLQNRPIGVHVDQDCKNTLSIEAIEPVTESW